MTGTQSPSRLIPQSLNEIWPRPRGKAYLMAAPQAIPSITLNCPPLDLWCAHLRPQAHSSNPRRRKIRRSPQSRILRLQRDHVRLVAVLRQANPRRVSLFGARHLHTSVSRGLMHCARRSARSKSLSPRRESKRNVNTSCTKKRCKRCKFDFSISPCRNERLSYLSLASMLSGCKSTHNLDSSDSTCLNKLFHRHTLHVHRTLLALQRKQV